MAENDAPSKALTTAQHKLIAALLISRTIRAACNAAKIPERTAFRWLGDARFQAALASAEGDQIGNATRRLLVLADKAIDVLESALDDEAASRAVRVRAAVLVLDQLLSLRELRNTESRLAALESAIYAKPTE